MKSASDVMHNLLLSAVVEAIEALRTSAGGLPNNLLRDLQGIHRNAATADLPKALQDSIAQSVRSAFNQLLKEGYAVGPKAEMQQSRPIDRVPDGERRNPGDRRLNRRTPGRRDESGRGSRGPGGPGRPGGGGPRPGGKPRKP